MDWKLEATNSALFSTNTTNVYLTMHRDGLVRASDDKANAAPDMRPQCVRLLAISQHLRLDGRESVLDRWATAIILRCSWIASTVHKQFVGMEILDISCRSLRIMAISHSNLLELKSAQKSDVTFAMAEAREWPSEFHNQFVKPEPRSSNRTNCAQLVPIRNWCRFH